MNKKALILFGLLSSTACGSTTEADYQPPAVRLDAPVEVTLGVGESARVGSSDLFATFLGATEDSRCPTDVTCVWEGNAALEVRLTLGDEPAATLRINTAVAPTSVDYDAVSFMIVRLVPDPDQAVPTQPADYRVTLRFSPR